MVRFVVVLALVVVSACQPGTAERCCQMAFPNRASVDDILAGYAGRRVYDQQMLITAIGDENVKRIIIAGDFTISQAITLPASRPGLIVEGVYGAEITSQAGIHVFTLLGERQTLRDLFVTGPGEPNTYLATVAAEGVRIQDVHASGLSLVRTTSASARLYVTDNRVSGLIQSGISVAGESMVIRDNHFPSGSLIVVNDESSRTRVAGNDVGGITITGAATERCTVRGNTLIGASAQIVTSSSGGKNAVSGNTGVATLTLHADDEEAANVAP